MLRFRPLKAKETEVRIDQVIDESYFRGVTLLLYKNARADMTILDETVGAENWQRRPLVVKDALYCDVGINRNYANEAASPVWVWKSDCGTESNYEEKKGESSDSFKRACVNWGIGRELYTAPVIRIKEGDCNLTQSNNGKIKCTDRYYVREMVVEDGEIVRLVIYNNGRGIKRNVFEYDKRKV